MQNAVFAPLKVSQKNRKEQQNLKPSVISKPFAMYEEQKGSGKKALGGCDVSNVYFKV